MILENTIDEREFLVIHPLDDVQEQKVETKAPRPHADDAGGTDIAAGSARLSGAHDVAGAVSRAGLGRLVRQGVGQQGGKRGHDPARGENT